MEDADTSAIEQAFKLEPGLTLNLLRLTNSVSSGLSTRITSLRHAITLLGRRQLMRWLQLLIYTSPQRDAAGNPLFALAATRGRMMELLAEKVRPGQRDFAEQAFMVGIMSLVPALLGVSMDDILGQLPVTPRVREALLDRQGPFGALLELATAGESADDTPPGDALLAARRAHPELTERIVGHCLEPALAWANNLDRDKG